MAIIKEIPGIVALVKVDHVPLQEYPQPPDDNDDNSRRATRYIVAEPGKRFIVELKRDPSCKIAGPDWDLNMELFIDGKRALGLLLKRNELGEKSVWFEKVHIDEGKGRWVSQHFMFSDLITDNSAPLPTSSGQIESAKAMGEIRLTVKRCIAYEDTAPTSSKFSYGGKVHEKALKGRALSRQACLGQAEASAAPNFTRIVGHDNEPIAEFKFRYRSLQDLKSEMIIPRSPSPAPIEERPDSELTREELLQRLEEARTANARIKAEGQRRIKRERDSGVGTPDDDDEEDGDIEVVNPPPKRPKVIQSIDLTGD